MVDNPKQVSELLTVIRNGRKHYARRLSRDVAWHADAQDIGNPELLVAAVEEHLDDNSLVIIYDARVQPLDLDQLRRMIGTGWPLAPWRLAVIASGLVNCLRVLHDASVPVRGLNPSMVGLLDREFVLIPVPAGVLPPLQQGLPTEIAELLDYLAPEVLRTRCLDSNLAYKADVYSLGRTLLALACRDDSASSDLDPFEQAEALVESGMALRMKPLPPDFEAFELLIARMCACDPDERPGMDELQSEFGRLCRELDPAAVIEAAIARQDIEAGMDAWEQLRAGENCPAFVYPQPEIHMLRAQLAMAGPSPDYTLAVDQCEKAGMLAPEDPAIPLYTARVYASFKKHAQHVSLADNYYSQAAKLSDWDCEIVEEWMGLLLTDPQPDILLKISDIPSDKRSAKVRTALIAGLIASGSHMKAWEESANYFQEFGFDESTYELASTASQFIEPIDLLAWGHHREGAENIPAAMALVWMRNGNSRMEKDCLSRAKHQSDGRETK